MIVDKIENRGLYRLPEELQDAMEYFATHDLTALDAGRYRMPGGLVMEVNEYLPTEENRELFEGYEERIFLRYMIGGSERMGYASKKEMTFVRMVSDELAMYAGEGNFLKLSQGSFVVLFPQDCYMLELADGSHMIAHNVSVSLKTGSAAAAAES